MHFDCKLEEHNSESVVIRFWSAEKASLLVKNIKLFSATDMSDSVGFVFKVYLDQNQDSNYKRQMIPFPCQHNYRTITFQVKDETNNQRYAVSIPFDTGKAAFKEI